MTDRMHEVSGEIGQRDVGTHRHPPQWVTLSMKCSKSGARSAGNWAVPLTPTAYPDTSQRADVNDLPQVTHDWADHRRRESTETKAGYKTTEFFMAVVFVIGILVATYADGDSLARADGWMFASFAVVAYLISRGLSKLGVREPYSDDNS